MKVIIIEEKDVRALMEKLEFEKLKLDGRQKTVDQIHRHFHYVLCNWFQEQGSSYPNA